MPRKSGCRILMGVSFLGALLTWNSTGHTAVICEKAGKNVKVTLRAAGPCKKGERLTIDLGALSADSTSLKTDVGALKTDVSGLKTDVGSVKTDASTLKTDAGSLKSDVSSLKTKVGSLETGLDDLETDLDVLQSNVDDIDSSISDTRRILQVAQESLTEGSEEVIGNNAFVDLQDFPELDISPIDPTSEIQVSVSTLVNLRIDPQNGGDPYLAAAVRLVDDTDTVLAGKSVFIPSAGPAANLSVTLEAITPAREDGMTFRLQLAPRGGTIASLTNGGTDGPSLFQATELTQ